MARNLNEKGVALTRLAGNIPEHTHYQPALTLTLIIYQHYQPSIIYQPALTEVNTQPVPSVN